MDLLFVRKIGATGYAEFGLGAVVDGADPQLALNEDVIRELAPNPNYIRAELRRQLAEIERRRQVFAGSRPPVEVAGRTVIIVDDGIATGGTVKAALKGLRKAGRPALSSPCRSRRLPPSRRLPRRATRSSAWPGRIHRRVLVLPYAIAGSFTTFATVPFDRLLAVMQ